MTTFTDEDKELIKELAAWTSEIILSVGLMKLLWHRWKQRQLCSVYQDKM